MRRNWRVTITDNDGEIQEYLFIAPNVWTVCAHIATQMRIKGDFYGHLSSDTIQLEVSELIQEANMPANTLTLSAQEV